MIIRVIKISCFLLTLYLILTLTLYWSPPSLLITLFISSPPTTPLSPSSSSKSTLLYKPKLHPLLLTNLSTLSLSIYNKKYLSKIIFSYLSSNFTIHPLTPLLIRIITIFLKHLYILIISPLFRILLFIIHFNLILYKSNFHLYLVFIIIFIHLRNNPKWYFKLNWYAFI
jgi:hypothetical protein